jgi:pyruvate/2-oxoglutarate dehydrogenase complex dihydrolipoamide dehydrogenase (E3) component
MATDYHQKLVVASGQAANSLAWIPAKLWQRSIVIEPVMTRGACPSVACLPSKNAISGEMCHA